MWVLSKRIDYSSEYNNTPQCEPVYPFWASFIAVIIYEPTNSFLISIKSSQSLLNKMKVANDGSIILTFSSI